MSPSEQDPLVCLITGANSGVGKATSKKLAAQDATVVMVCRNEERGEAARQEVIEESGNDRVELLLADLSHQREIHRLAADFKVRHNRLNVLINNAGIYRAEGTLTEDGIEKTFAVNHLAPFLLTRLLEDVLRHGAPARVINVSSEAHRGVREIDEDAIQSGPYNGLKAYAQSKLANLLFTHELSRRLPSDEVTVNAMNPGMVATGFWKGKSNLLGRVMQFMQPLMNDPDESGEALLYLATSPDLEGVTGRYFDKTQEAEASAASHDEELAQHIWELSEELTDLK